MTKSSIFMFELGDKLFRKRCVVAVSFHNASKRKREGFTLASQDGNDVNASQQGWPLGPFLPGATNALQ